LVLGVIDLYKCLLFLSQLVYGRIITGEACESDSHFCV